MKENIILKVMFITITEVMFITEEKYIENKQILTLL